MKDRCIRCAAETAYDETTHIDLRVGYIEGAGQLCINCYRLTSGELDHLSHFLVPVYTVRSTPNDMELGIKVRKLYYESLEK